MLTCYVLRVVAQAEGGQLAGTLQRVDDGSTVTFRSVDELLAALVPRAPDDSGPARVIRLDASGRD